MLTCQLSLFECLLYIECHLNLFECLLYIYVEWHLNSFVFIICDIVYLCRVFGDTALECVLQELLKAIHTELIFRIIGEY